MKIPPGWTEKEVVVIINSVANRLARRFLFGYHDLDDMKQQARMFAWEGLAKYDNKRPLENFLWTHVRNRLCNYKRDNYERLVTPCDKCPYDSYDEIQDRCLKFEDKDACTFYWGWYQRNSAKKNLMSPIELGGVQDDGEDNMKIFEAGDDIVAFSEIIVLLDKEIPIEFRTDYLKLCQGIKLPKHRAIKIRQIVQEILEENGIWQMR
jgi:hypothetical protein